MKNPFQRTATAAETMSPATEPIPLAIDTPEPSPTPTRAARRRTAGAMRRRWPLVAGATAVIMLGTGAVAYANARKTVELDVDGKVTTVTTFAGSVDSLLAEQGVDVGNRDLVVPAADSSLREGGDVVVRYAHEVTVQVDGEQKAVWLTELDADDALATLAERGDDVRLVASRSEVGGRISLPLRLDANEPVNLVVDGTSTVVNDGDQGAAAVLDKAGVHVGELDRVSVLRDESATVSVSLVVQRVTVEEVPTTAPVAFETVTEEDPSRYADLAPAVKQAGVEGVQTTVNRVTTVDGVVESSELVSDAITAEPVQQIMVQGTKERPKPAPAPAPKAAPAPAAPAAPGDSSVGGGTWAALAKCESGGNPAAVSSNGKYHGLYQFSVSTWKAMGGTGLPSQASAEEQTQRAQALQAKSGWGQWPACSRKLGLL